MNFSAADQEAIVREVARAPSVHNIQPARWRFAEGRVTLFRALDRTIPVADPTSHDLQASLGAAFEGMAIALSTRGALLSAPQPSNEPAPSECDPVCAASFTTSASPPDPLAEWVLKRRSFRGKFAKATDADAGELGGKVHAPDVMLIWGGSTLGEIAPLHDAATWSFESRPEYHAELWKWLRLSKGDPRYSRDGLNADCLALSAPERWAANRLLAPPVFELLKKVGVARALVSEAPQVKSAAAAILFTPRKDTEPFDVGRRMYRLWLEITRAGFYLAPMSASADNAETRDSLSRRFQVPHDRRIANVFRIGRQNEDSVAISPRLPVDELLVSS